MLAIGANFSVISVFVFSTLGADCSSVAAATDSTWRIASTGSACEAFGDLDTLRKAYQEWPLFSTFIDNIEMSLAKTDERIQPHLASLIISQCSGGRRQRPKRCRGSGEWPLFSTFIDNIEMSLAKTDERIAKMYLALGDRDDLRDKVLNEMELTRKWVLKIVGDTWPLQHRQG